jgi:hypothetical protein
MHVDGPHYRCSRGVDFGHGSRCKASAVRADGTLDAIASGLQKNLLAPARLRAVKGRLERLVDEERRASKDGDTAGLEKRIAELDRQVSEGIGRITLLPKSLVPEMAKGIDALRAQRDALIRQRESIGRSQAGGRLPLEDRVAAALAAAYGLRDALRSADPGLLNHLFRALGVRVNVSPGAAAVIVDPMPEAETVETCFVSEPTRNKSHAPILSFTVAVPAGRPGPKPRRKAG